VRFILHFYRSTCFNLDLSVDGLSLRNPWNSPAKKFTAEKLKRKEYHTGADFSKDFQLVFSNAMEFKLKKKSDPRRRADFEGMLFSSGRSRSLEG